MEGQALSPKSRFSFGLAEHLNSCPSVGHSRSVLHSPTASDGPQSSATRASGRWPSTPHTSCPQPLLSLTGPPQATTGQKVISSQDRHPFCHLLTMPGPIGQPAWTIRNNDPGASEDSCAFQSQRMAPALLARAAPALLGLTLSPPHPAPRVTVCLTLSPGCLLQQGPLSDSNRTLKPSEFPPRSRKTRCFIVTLQASPHPFLQDPLMKATL